ncbi:methyltransferase domain-containing protein [Shewanella algidipiscicola]|uniref:methyltransferase domain-containing protein n=1 Tax=Shewanella algidipiscicola TaxID=614070 RepID=UPI000E74A200|nr:methyltransferase domain-containing protein [Shewanella algidipiscicola]
MNSHYLCPVCQAQMSIHEASQGLHCPKKHHLDKNEQGYWVFSQAKKPHMDSRQVMRAKRFLLESGVFTPLLDALKQQLTLALAEYVTDQNVAVNHLDFDCGDGFYLRSLTDTLQGVTTNSSQTGIGEAENALFAAVKSHPEATYIVSQLKQLPFVDECFDIVTLIDKPLKGKELLRVLKPNGLFVQVSPGPRHLWQIKQYLYKDLAEKPAVPTLAKGLELIHQQRVSFTLNVTPDEAVTLLEMTPYAWRAADKVKRQMSTGDFSQLEVDFYLTLSRKQMIEKVN